VLNASLIDIPQPFIDPIDALVEALGIACLSIPRPLTAHTIAIVTDAQRRCIAMVRFPTLTESSIHAIVGHSSLLPDAHSVVLVSVRTTAPISTTDPDLLQRCTNIVNNAGLQLLDWAVIGVGGLYCPRSLTESADPWSSSASCL
jgi:hypothetical protein